MAQTAKRLSHDQYTVGWICALPLEMTAASVMLDNEHGSTQGQDRTDQNIYLLGEILDHNVVIACLPNVAGTASAATVAAQMLRSFTSIKFGLMVGIGGGIPSAKVDIRLGDVVVSRPDNIFGGVVQYDLGKQLNGEKFQRTGSLNKPPYVLLSALNMLQSNHQKRRSKLGTLCSKTLQRYPDMREMFGRPYQEDNLYSSDYMHEDRNQRCENCDRSKLLARPLRQSSPMEPRIHYGTIASGNKVIKDAVSRDKLSKELGGVLSVEMEAAGLMDHFPCLVIRGISDYADSHKNDGWQGYAAMTAAAYAKELLNCINSSDVKKTVTAKEKVGPIAEQYPSASSMGTMTRSDPFLTELQSPSQQGASLSKQYPPGMGWPSAPRTITQYDQFLPQPGQPYGAHPASPPNQYSPGPGRPPALSSPVPNHLPYGVAPSTHPQPRPTPNRVGNSDSDLTRPQGNIQGSGGMHRKAVGSPPAENVGYSQAAKMVYPQSPKPSHSRHSGPPTRHHPSPPIHHRPSPPIHHHTSPPIHHRPSPPIHHHPGPSIPLRPLTRPHHHSRPSNPQGTTETTATYIYAPTTVEFTPQGAPEPSGEHSESESDHGSSQHSDTASEGSDGEDTSPIEEVASPIDEVASPIEESDDGEESDHDVGDSNHEFYNPTIETDEGDEEFNCGCFGGDSDNEDSCWGSCGLCGCCCDDGDEKDRDSNDGKEKDGCCIVM